MEKKDLLELKRRKEIYNIVSNSPGLHKREISRRINMPFSSLGYHLNYLEKHQLILPKLDGKYKRYYITLEIGRNEKKILNFLRRKTAFYMIIWMLMIVGCSQRDFSEFLEKHPATISFYLRKMKQLDIIEEVISNKGIISKDTMPKIITRPQITSEKIYVLKDPWMVYDLVIKHKENLLDEQMINTLMKFVDFTCSDGIPNKIPNPHDSFDSVVKAFCDFFFPPSFCS